MKITKAEKFIDKDSKSETYQVIDDGVVRCIPKSLDNTDYKSLIKDEADGKIVITDSKTNLEVQPIGDV